MSAVHPGEWTFSDFLHHLDDEHGWGEYPDVEAPLAGTEAGGSLRRDCTARSVHPTHHREVAGSNPARGVASPAASTPCVYALKRRGDDSATCVLCGRGDEYDNPIFLSDLGLPFVSVPFPVHPECGEQLLDGFQEQA